MTTAPPRIHNAPDDLIALRQWVCWRYQHRKGRPTKVPYTPGTQARASSTDTATWRAFDDAAADQTSSGVGFVFTDSDPFVGVDLDDCLVNGVLKPWADDLLASLPATYTEISPSGNGLKLWVRGELPAKAKHRRKIEDGEGNAIGEIEVYDRGRFFTLTGERWGDAREIAKADIAQWHRRWFPVAGQSIMPPPTDADVGFDGPDDAMIAAIRRSRQAGLFDALWRGDLDNHHGDHSSADMALCNILAFWCGPNPERIDGVFRESGLCRDKWLDREDYRHRTINEAVGNCSSFYVPRQKMMRPRRDSEVFARASQAKPYMATDLGNAERMAEHYADAIRFCHQTDRWYIWDGRRWAIDNAGRITAYAAATVREIYTEAKKCHAIDTEIAASLSKHGIKSEAHGRIQAMIRLAACQPGIAVEVDDLDADPWLLNTTTGTVDLRTGVQKEHDPDDLITQCTTCGYHPGVAAPLWVAFLKRIFHGNQELIDYVQEMLGMCLSGDISEQILPVFFGDGANGKSTLLDTVVAVAGGYAGKAAPDLIMARKNESHPTEVADLWGKRLVIASETDEGRKLRTSFVKETTGDATLKARYMRGDFFTFRRTHKLLLMTNNKPRVTEGKHAIWRRLKLVPFTATIADSEKDPHLGSKLMRESVGILAWLVAGCKRWNESGGFDEPVEVSDATAEYKAEEDPVAEFVGACLEVDPDGFASSRDIRKVYQAWCRDEGIQYPLSDRGLMLRIYGIEGAEKEVRRVSGQVTRGANGIRLKSVTQAGSAKSSGEGGLE